MQLLFLQHGEAWTSVFSWVTLLYTTYHMKLSHCHHHHHPHHYHHQIIITVYRVSQEEWTKLREGVPYVRLYRYNPKHLCPKLNDYSDNGQIKLWTSFESTNDSCQLVSLIYICSPVRHINSADARLSFKVHTVVS